MTRCHFDRDDWYLWLPDVDPTASWEFDVPDDVLNRYRRALKALGKAEAELLKAISSQPGYTP